MKPRAPNRESIALYLRFRTLLDGLKDLPESEEMTPQLEKLLAVIGAAWYSGKPLIVRQFLIQEDLGSPATIHKRIHQLKGAGFVGFEGQQGDSRVRLVVPTERAIGMLVRI